MPETDVLFGVILTTDFKVLNIAEYHIYIELSRLENDSFRVLSLRLKVDFMAYL